jgi:hypothetical protein
MEKRKEQFEESEEIGQVIKWDEFENDFLKQSFEGVIIIDNKGVVRRDVMYEDLIEELVIDNIKEIKYIPEQLAVKVIYINEKYDMFYRE